MRFVIALVIDLLLVILHPLRILRRAFAAPRNAFIEVVVKGHVVEMPRRVPFWERRERPLALESLRRVVTLVRDDARVAGILFRLEDFHGGSARATSLRNILLEARAAGKRVVAYLPHGGGTLSAYIASAADQIVLGPETHLDLVGFAVEASYLRGALDRAGFEPEVFAKGRYKTAGEFLQRKSMSEAQREQVGAVLDAAYESLLSGLAEGRKVDRARAAEWIDRGPWSAKAALEAGIADGIAYDDELRRQLHPSREQEVPLVSAAGYASRRRPRFRPLLRPRHLAVVEVSGAIVSEAPMSLMPVAAEEPICATLRAVRDDRRVSGVVLSVSSRGGSALASDRILRDVRLLSEKKPVIAYFGDIAASGGYMVAMGAHAIVAQPTTITGSIGVVAARLVGTSLLKKLGISVEVVKRGAHADMHNPARRLEPEETAHLERQIDEVYRGFLEAVAKGRSKPIEAIEPLAGGRVWSGRDAKQHGLIDILGGFDVALAELRKRLGAGAEKLDPVVRGPLRLPRPALLGRLLPRGSWTELLPLMLEQPRARAWLWCEVAPAREI